MWERCLNCRLVFGERDFLARMRTNIGHAILDRCGGGRLNCALYLMYLELLAGIVINQNLNMNKIIFFIMHFSLCIF